MTDEWKSTSCEFEVIRLLGRLGQLRRVSFVGDVCQGKAWPDGTVSAENPYFKGISDEVDPDGIVIKKA
ncbi:hypothetical protein GCM10010912_16400 [Paenibacillus albidus]|uniref:Uncharacterized protein n=1 Tax=Paenibacillus albidus TaxID=2041023 RepID=A0A917C4P2_9BACL|nr:hypothetical protein [Paenibacillus albidus]GGF71998.1 hypothetical protein GCM10010912_16400 [Paenibacillus albidus]